MAYKLLKITKNTGQHKFVLEKNIVVVVVFVIDGRKQHVLLASSILYLSPLMSLACQLYLSEYFMKADTLSRFQMDSGILGRQ